MLRFMPYLRIALAAIICLLIPSLSFGRQTQPPYSWNHPTKAITAIPELTLGSVDKQRLLADDDSVSMLIGKQAAVTKRLRIAVPNTVSIHPQNSGQWENLPEGAHLWRMRIRAEGATDLNFGFGSFELPSGAQLHLLSGTEAYYDGAYTSEDNTSTQQFWSPLIPGDSATIELYLPAGAALTPTAMELTYVGAGYRDAFMRSGGPGLSASGTCNIDVVCPLGDPYQNEIRAVARYTFRDTGGTYLCSGTLVMDQPRDFKNYFLTANHCVDGSAAATSMTLYWNYQSPTCGLHGGGSLAQSQTGGASYRASREDVDFSLVELNATPPVSYNVYYAGWDVSGIAPGGSVGIHHPGGYVKAITQNTLPLPTIDSCIGSGGSNTHWQTGPYAQGTTEGGSSGSAIFVPVGDISGHQRLVIGTLSGGEAACSGALPNGETDCYGKLSVAWMGGTSDAQRLQPWLDPNHTNPVIVAGGQPTAVSSSALTPGRFYYRRPPIAPAPLP